MKIFPLYIYPKIPDKAVKKRGAQLYAPRRAGARSSARKSKKKSRNKLFAFVRIASARSYARNGAQKFKNRFNGQGLCTCSARLLFSSSPLPPRATLPLWGITHHCYFLVTNWVAYHLAQSKLTWLVLGEDPAARSHRVEQFTAL